MQSFPAADHDLRANFSVKRRQSATMEDRQSEQRNVGNLSPVQEITRCNPVHVKEADVVRPEYVPGQVCQCRE